MLDFPYRLKVGSKPRPLIKILHVWFDVLGFLAPKSSKNWEALGQNYTKETEQAVRDYQMRRGLKVTGIVTALEWNELGIELGYLIYEPKLYECIYGTKSNCTAQDVAFFNRIGYKGNKLYGGVNIWMPNFITRYFREFAGVSIATFDGLEQFLTFMGNDANLTDVRHVAYMMATVHHETGGTWLPIGEKNGANKWYGKPVTVSCGGKNYTNRYYGRGYIQLTRTSDVANNGGLYHDIGQKLGMGCQLVAKPDLVTYPQIAYKIASQGMKDGWFRPRQTLFKYINGNKRDYYNAREIINNDKTHPSSVIGLSIGMLIESYAKFFEASIRVAMFR